MDASELSGYFFITVSALIFGIMIGGAGVNCYYEMASPDVIKCERVSNLACVCKAGLKKEE